MHSEHLIMKNDINVISLALKEKFKDFRIPFYHISHIDVEQFTSDSPYILWILGNEDHKNFDHKFNDKNCKAIIKPYPYIKNYNPINQSYFYEKNTGKIFVLTEKEDERILNIPLGQTKNFVPQKKENRDIPIGFYGQMSGIRNTIIYNIPHIKSFIYKNFGISREGDEYCNFLNRCDISFCPVGQSPETYRLYESGLSGCALIGTPLPYTEYYKECPIISIPWQNFNSNNIEKLNEIIESILSKKQEYQKESLVWANKWTNIDFLYLEISKHLKKIEV